jgi:hypothetical protein
MGENMRLQAAALLDSIVEESWLLWAQRHDLMPAMEVEHVRAVRVEEEHQMREERKRQEVARRAEVAARQRATLAAQQQVTSSQAGRTSRVASECRSHIESVGEDVEMLSDAGPATQGKGSVVKEEEEEGAVLVRRDVALVFFFLLTFH